MINLFILEFKGIKKNSSEITAIFKIAKALIYPTNTLEESKNAK
jgi:hypothetical protein